MSRIVRLELADIGHDLIPVLKEVLGDCRDELALVSEDTGPGLDGVQVVLHVLAYIELFRHLLAEEEELKATLGDVVPATSLEVLDDLDELVVHSSSGVASLNLGQMVVCGHAVDETSQNVVDHDYVNVVAIVSIRVDLRWFGCK